MAQFIEVFFITYDGKLRELINSDLSEVETLRQRRKLDINEIEGYEEAIPASHGFDKNNLIATEVFMKSGNSFVIDIPFDEFEKLLNDFEI